MGDNGRQWHFRLFIAGNSPQSQQAVVDLDNIVEAYVRAKVEITVVDLFENPEVASEKDILAIPTLIREQPTPPMRVIGDLSDGERVWRILNA